jgi:segregation and condensation protein B
MSNRAPLRQCIASRWKNQARGFVKLWQFRTSATLTDTGPHGPLWRDNSLAKVEAALFIAKEPLPSRKIAYLANLADGTQVRTLIRRLNDLYDAGQSAMRVEEVAGGYRLFTRPELSAWLRKSLASQGWARLSAPAMETLAVVAYRQPILRAEIEAIRGVQCDDILRQLLDRELIRIMGRSEDLGRPLLYGTTKRFLELFGLRDLEQLPRAAELIGAGMIAEEDEQTSDEKQNPGTSGAGNKLPNDPISEEEAVTTRIRPMKASEELVGDELETQGLSALGAALVGGAFQSPSAAKDEDEDEEEDEDWDDDEDDDDDDEEEDDEEWEEDDADDDLEDDDWEEVDDDEEDDEEDDDEADEEDDEEWDDDDEEEDEEFEDDGAE